MDSQTPTKNSSSYIIISCYGDSDPEHNRLQLRTESPTFIKLQPGNNILTVEDYPELKYGFSQIDDPEKDCYTNCEDVWEIDFSHFDGSQIRTMDRMFYKMPITLLTFGEMTTPNLISAKMAFSKIGSRDGIIEEIDLSNFDFRKLENADCMFQGANVHTLKLNNANLESLVSARKFIRHSAIKKLELNDLKIKDAKILDIHIYTPVTVFLKNVARNTVTGIIDTIETLRNQYGDSTSSSYMLDESLSVCVEKQNGEIECTFANVPELSVSEFLDRVNSYLNGELQDTPEIIWFDNKSYDHLKFARTPDYLGLAETLSSNQHITKDDFVGSRIGMHLENNNEDGSVTLMMPESIFHYDNGKLREKIVILRCMSSERGQKAIELGKLIKEVTGIAVIIFMPYFQKEKIMASFNGYSQFRLKDR